MKNFDYIRHAHVSLDEALDKVFYAFNHRRRHNNTTQFEAIQTAVLADVFYVIMVVSYDDYKQQDGTPPPTRPSWIGQAPEMGTTQTIKDTVKPWMVNTEDDL